MGPIGTETETSSVYWTHLSRFHLKTEKEYSPKRRVLNKGAMDDVQYCDSHINILSSEA
jgi:hypothetical protein